MVQVIGQAGRFALLQSSSLFFLLLLLAVPLVLSNHAPGALLGMLLFALLFFLPGYLLLGIFGDLPASLRILISPVFGLVSVTTAYNIFALASITAFFPYLVVMLSIAGMVRFALHLKTGSAGKPWSDQGHETVAAGSIVGLSVALVFWRSGRFSNAEFVFYGPAGHDQLYHVTLLQRLLHHVPPDNFIVSGLTASVYHYFSDLAQALILRAQSALHLGGTDLFDLYFRGYPTLLYFLLGALAYRTGRQLLGSRRGGALSVLLLLGGGGLGCLLGAVQTAAHASKFSAMRASLFSAWSSWDGVDSILPLVHRPAHYHGLLICLAAINVLLRADRSRRDWILAGLLFGLMAGFNFTLAATFGVAAVLGSVILFLQRTGDEGRNVAWLAVAIFLGSLPVTAAMVTAGFHNPAPGLPFGGPNLEFPTAIWGGLLSRMIPLALVPWAALILFPIVAYGVKLFGFGALARLDLGEDRHRGVATVLAVAFALSYVVGMFFPYQAFGGIGIIFLQPTLWILGLFALRPIDIWLHAKNSRRRQVAVLGLLGLTWVQSLAAFNVSHKIAFSEDAAHVLQDIRQTAAPDDVVAFLPTGLTASPIWSYPEESTNFSVTAMTGLDGYFSSETYSKFDAVPGLAGQDPAHTLAQAKDLYQQRRDDIESFLRGDIQEAALARLAKDRVRWIVVSGPALQEVSSQATPWRKTREISVYHFPR